MRKLTEFNSKWEANSLAYIWFAAGCMVGMTIMAILITILNSINWNELPL